MQLTMSIQLSGEAEDVAAAMGSIAAVFPQELAAEPPSAGTLWWTSERADELVRQITDNARHALQVICENAPTVPFDVVLDALGMDGVSTGGVMASVGFALQRMGAPQLLARNYGRRLYLIDPSVAEVIIEALGRHGS